MARFEVAFWELTALVLAASIFVLVDSQDQSGFISIDCGSTASYDDDVTGLHYVPDTDYINSGENKNIAPKYYGNYVKRLDTVRSFPEGTRNCYTLKPLQAGAGKFLIRARFFYGNYDLTSNFPEFDLYIGVNFWSTVTISDDEVGYTEEMIHTPSGNVINVCLVNKGLGTPFITLLELRPVANKDIYSSKNGSLSLSFRLNLGTNSTNKYRYDYDIYDRVWNTIDWTDATTSIETTQTVTPNLYYQPSEVMKTGVTPINPLKPLEILINNVNSEHGYYIYLHFAEIQTLGKDEFRGFNLYLNGSLYYGKPIILEPLSAFTLFTSDPVTAKNLLNFSLIMTDNSTLPPIINALEVYSLTYMSQLETDGKEVLAINNLKSAYNVSKIWQGDPCAPQHYSWDGLNCSFSDKEPRITSLNLSSSDLKGEITKYIASLTMLQNLDLSNNSLTGTVPDFLQDLSSLKFLDLSNNNLSGTLPVYLAQKSKARTLILNVEGNQHLCLSSPCNAILPDDNKKTNSVLIPIVAAIVGALVLITVTLFAVFCIFRRKEPQPPEATKAPVVIPTRVPSEDKARETIESRNQRFTYSEVLSITNNLTRIIGRGGFGTVYHGHLDDIQVAVKMLSLSSSQGYKEFKAEAQILMRVHHRNLTSLVGYCDEGDKMGLIYEFMSQGDLYNHISEANPQHLTWEERLHILLDAAQGLEYLHNGCKPQIVHRDIKSTNILLNDKLEAKLADFGLSRACVPDAGGQTGFMPTVVAGTPGYLDPEYYHTQQLHEMSDVFSFGIVLLEVISSKPIMVTGTHGKIHISEWVSQILSTQGDVKGILDSRLKGDYDKNSVWKFVELAMTCVLPISKQRPTMSEVVNELSQCLRLEKARKTEGVTTDTINSVEMLSLGKEDEYALLAR